jgi:hypothetical protein
MVPFGIIPLRQQAEEVDKPHLEMANSHNFTQPRQMCRSVQDGTDKHVFYTNRYTIPAMKIQALLSSDRPSPFQAGTKTAPAKYCRTTPKFSGVERLHDHLPRIRQSHPFTYNEHSLSSSLSDYVLSSETTSPEVRSIYTKNKATCLAKTRLRSTTFFPVRLVHLFLCAMIAL